MREVHASVEMGVGANKSTCQGRLFLTVFKQAPIP